jgi:hypothetical protein
MRDFVCHECHEMFHPGLANVNGRLNDVFSRLKTVNGWDGAEAGQWMRWARTVFTQRSRNRWELDLSAFADFGTFKVSDKWRREGDDGIIVSGNSRDYGGRTHTRIVGAEWTIGEPGHGKRSGTN